MIKYILLAIISFNLIGCFQDKYKLEMQGAASSVTSNEEEEYSDEEYSCPFDEFLYLLENATDERAIAFFEKMLKKDPNVLNTLYLRPDGDRESFIHCAAAKASLKVIEKLFEVTEDKVALANIESVDKVRPLHLAALRGDYDIVQYFIGQGADPNAKDVEDSTVLHYASKKRANIKVVELLLANGASIENTIDAQDGTTLLHCAVQEDNISLVKFLLNYYLKNHPDLIAKKTTRKKSLTAEEFAHYLGRRSIISIFNAFNKKNLNV